MVELLFALLIIKKTILTRLRKNGKCDEDPPLRSAHKSGVQGTKSLAGVRGVPEKTLFTSFAAVGGKL
jgi:hypothetical protein